MNQQVATKSPQAVLNGYFQNNKPQLAAALPKHLNPDRMARLALTAFSQNNEQCRALKELDA
jgi:recombination protein RecT